MLKGMRKLKDGETFVLRDTTKCDYCSARLIERQGQGRCVIEVESDSDTHSVLEAIGFPPLPPYIRRDDDPETAVEDKRRYQTVYASENGAVAAPTAGLHFTDGLLEKMREMGVVAAQVTLHVGAGTFKPVKTQELEDHEIHEEWFSIDAENAGIVNESKHRGGRIVAVGTTSVRTLESVAADGRIDARSGATQLFITPGYKFKIVDAMITNFHLPKSTLLALVAAFAGLDNIMAAYKHAIEQQYRFYSYGDAMLIF
jgi:S-adenosylmethionine:tRNA ribosyltransferase-isomerase